MKERIQQLQTTAEAWSPERALRWSFETFGTSVAISSAFGAEGMVLIDIASRVIFAHPLHPRGAPRGRPPRRPMVLSSFYLPVPDSRVADR
jgi:3'-phosphoadenosine 5'-phosphosulfate sulfotransferase (PAPS reductase)/FAD synthetase